MPDSGADLEGPRLVQASLPRFASEVPVVLEVELELSEPADPMTVTPRHLTLLRWEELGRCDLTPVCAKGRCAAGRCWQDPLSASALSALDRGEFGAEDDALLELEVEVDGTRLRISPLRTLEPHGLFSLVVGEGLRDASGAGLQDEWGLATRWRSDFVTAGEGSAGPEPRLVLPVAGAALVPTNLSRLETRFVRPVVVDASATLLLATDEGTPVLELRRPAACSGWAPGFCLAWDVEHDLMPDTVHRVVAGTLVDGQGRGVVAPFADESFRSGPGPDLVPPDLESTWVQVRGPCVVARVEAAELLQVSMTIGEVAVEVAGSGTLTLAARVPDEAAGSVVVEAVDLAGNVASVEHGLDEYTLPSDPPTLSITEVLANPAGPEPHQEFVELANFGVVAVDLTDLWLADRTWEDVSVVLAGGAPPIGDAISSGTLAPGGIALIVASGFDPHEGSDEPPPATAMLLRVDASLGAGGLKNAGEALTLYRADPPRLVASYGNFVDTSSSVHGGRSVAIVRPDACDVALSWRSQPLGRATPGRLP